MYYHLTYFRQDGIVNWLDGTDEEKDGEPWIKGSPFDRSWTFAIGIQMTDGDSVMQFNIKNWSKFVWNLVRFQLTLNHDL